MAKEKILIVDDEDRIRDMIKEYIEPENFDIEEADNGKSALDLFENSVYSLIIMDVMMPKMDGWTTVREIRRTSQVPIIMLSARGEEYDKVFGFELGVDDYIVKPFSPRELLYRIKAILRRASGMSGEILETNAIKLEGLSIDFNSRKVKVDSEDITLTPKEYELLSFLVKNQNRVFSREQLLDKVWGYEFAGDYRTVDTHIKMLRESIKEYRKFIITVWGTGYKFETGGQK